jgi:TonB-dependent receptor
MNRRSFRANCVRNSAPHLGRVSYFRSRSLLAATTLAVAGSAFAAAPSSQDVDRTDQVEEVVVTGLRASLQSAQEIKRNSEQIVDSISATDISALPDRSVTEALQRIPGIAIDHLFAPNDTNRFSAEGSGVVIRGMTQVRSELNGRDVFSARNTRGLSFEDVPSELMAGVDVYKNPSADMIEGGIAGSVNLRTRMPFDSPGQVLGFTGGVNYGDFAEKSKPSASALYSNRWDTGIGEIGFLVDVAYSELATRTDSIQFGRLFRRRAADVGATGGEEDCPDMSSPGATFTCVYVPGGARWSELDFIRKRKGYAAAVQWRPNDRVEANVQAMRSDYDRNWREHSGWFQDSYYNVGPAAGTSFQFDDDGLFQSGVLATTAWHGNQDQVGGDGVPTGSTTRFAETNQVTTEYSAGVKFDATDRLSFNFDVQYVKATGKATDYTVNTESMPRTLSIDLDGSLPAVTVGPDGYLETASNYYWSAGMDDTQDNKADQVAARLDGSFDIDSGWFKSIRVGTRYTDRDATNKDTGYNWNPITEWWQGNSSGGWPGDLAGVDKYMADHATLFTFSNFYRGDTKLPAGIWVASDDLVKNLIGNAATIKGAEINGSGWAPDKFGEFDINTQKEKTYAAYALLRFGKEDLALPIDGNIGVRWVKTKSEAVGYAQEPDWTTYALLDPAIANLGRNQAVPIDLENEYSDVLPSFNLRVKITDDLQWRFAASKAIARPTLDQLRANVKLGGTIQTTYDGTNNPIDQHVLEFTGDGGNPLLKPMKATQFDTALEWYFAPQGSLFGTVFYKDVKDYFITGTATQSLFGQDWAVKSTINGDSGTISGFEVGYTQFYDFLPGIFRGFGIQANYTYVDSKGAPGPTAGDYTVPGLPLEGLSKNSYNFVVMYQRGPIEARLAYNWRERWLLTTADGDDKGTVWNDDFGQLDGSFFYRFTDNVQLGIEANNLTNTAQKLLVGPYKYKDDGAAAYNNGYVDNRLYRNGWFTFDRRVALTLRVTF